MKILVTGTSGHLGEAMARTLIEKGIPYLGVDMNPSQFTSRVGTITDAGFVDGATRNIDYIVHTATLHKPHVKTHSDQDFIDTNITGTLNLLNAARKNRVKGFI